MRNNSLYNINQNKILEDKLSNQMTNQSKITRPSDDPVVAIRALRLRTNVTMVSQYYDKNTEDADSWLSITGDALNTVGSVLQDIYEQAETASKKFFTASDLDIVLTQMNALAKEFYASGNVDYAGRYVFSGFRTDTPITFTEENIKEFNQDPENRKNYIIEESRGYKDITSISYTDWQGANGVKDDETQIKNTTLYRFRLSYDDLDESIKTNGNPPTADAFQITITGAGQPANVTVYADAESAYKAIAADTTGEAVAYIPSTGEIVFGEAYYNDPLKVNENMKVDVKYSKSTWEEGDINPVHYFHCIESDEKNAFKAMNLDSAKKTLETAQSQLEVVEADKNSTQAQIDAARQAVKDAQDVVDDIMGHVIEYNMEGKDQDIYYAMGFNQDIQVNTHAHEVFTHEVRRDMDDFKVYLKQLKDVEAAKADIETKMKEYPEDSDEYKDLKLKMDAADKAYTYIRENVQKKFENQLTKCQSYIDETNVAVTDNGTRRSRLELIKNRLMGQKATFKDLQSSNEDIDVTEVAVQLKSSELTYEAALAATSKIMQTNLMNYI
jgi:flagellar hook-associated protein 3 FlgL